MSNGRIVERRKQLVEQLNRELERREKNKNVCSDPDSLVAFLRAKEDQARSEIAALPAREQSFMFQYIGLQAKIEMLSALQVELRPSDKLVNELRKQVEDIDKELSVPITTQY